MSTTQDKDISQGRIALISLLADTVKALKALSQGTILFVFLLLWEVLPRSGLIDPMFLPPFSTVAATLLGMVISGEIFPHLFISLQRSVMGFILAVIVAIPLGIVMGWYRYFEFFVNPLVETLRNIPTLALYPVLILFLGIGEVSKVAIIFVVALWKILINTISGVKNVEPLHIKSARSLGVTSDWGIFRKVILPSIVPQVVSGMRLGATSAILILVAAEMLGAKEGLGFLVVNSQYNFWIPKMYASIIALTILGVTTNYALVWFEAKATKWKEQTIGKEE